MPEKLDVAIGVFFLLFALERIKLFVVEIEVAVVIPLGAVAVFAAAHAVIGVVCVVVVGFCGSVAVQLVQDEETCDDKQKDDD
jgi:hypothetical protein